MYLHVPRFICSTEYPPLYTARSNVKLVTSTEIGTHTAHSDERNRKDEVESQDLSAPLVQGIHAHDYHNYIRRKLKLALSSKNQESYMYKKQSLESWRLSIRDMIASGGNWMKDIISIIP